MKGRIEIVAGPNSVSTDEYKICTMIMKDQRFDYSTWVDVPRMMQLSRGLRSPLSGFAMVLPDETVAVSYFDLVEWIIKLGLKDC